MSTKEYKVITPIINAKNDPSAYLNAFPIFFFNHVPLFKDVDHYHKVHILDDIHLARIEPYLRDGQIIYECNRHELEPTKICMVKQKADDNNEVYLEIEDVSIEYLMNANVDTNGMDNLEIFNIIKDYINGNFKLTANIVKYLNGLYYKPSLENYLFLPLLVYIIKKHISTTKSATT